MKHFLAVVFLVGSFFATGQNSGITGTVIDDEVADVLPFANVLVKGTNIGTTTDFDGKYVLNVEPGTYTLVFSFVGYQTKEITEVVVVANDYTIVDVSLGSAANALQEVVVTTSARRNSETSVLQLQKKSIKLLDGLSLESIKKTGAGDIASAVKAVPGVSVQGGKYVYVRGLGDRYTKTILNGLDIPGLDPDRNTIQMDIFPTSLVDNIQVVKNFTADSPADFTGGFVDIITKDIPVKKEFSISVSGAYNERMHFKDNFVNSNSSDTDFLGFDDGQRDMPISRVVNIPPPSSGSPLLSVLTGLFDPEMAVRRETSDPNFGFGFTAGNAYNIGDSSQLGFQASLSYKNETTFYEKAENNFWFKDRSDNSILELEPNRLQKGDLGIRNVLLTGMLGVSLKTESSKIKLNLLRVQNGENRAGFFNVSSVLFDVVNGVRDNIEYTEKTISTAQLVGTHSFDGGDLVLDWAVSPTFSEAKDRDVRFTSFEISDTGDLIIRPSSFGPPTRLWRDLEEVNLNAKIGIKQKHQLFGFPAELSVGGATTFKKRDYWINQFFFTVRDNPIPIDGNANNLLLPENIWDDDTDRGTFVTGNFEPANSFRAKSIVNALYISEDFQVLKKLKAILGVRYEQYTLKYTGQNNQGTVVLENEKVIDVEDLFPSVNLIYDFDNDGNYKLRSSYTRTTARPSFKEASVAEIFDPLTGEVFIGNLDVQPTYVDNFDLRFERYGARGNFFAASLFYKNFEDPIELVAFEQAPNNFQPRNVPTADVYGVELELRQNFGFITEGLRKFALNANYSLIKSEVDMSDTEFNSRKLAEREGETIDNTRELQGQSPFLVNAGLTYNGEDNGWQAGVFYNVQGKTLQVVGIRAVPDVYTLPFNNLSANLSKAFGPNKNQSISLKVSNLLDDEIESVYESFGAQDQIYSIRRPGQEFSFSYSFKF